MMIYHYNTLPPEAREASPPVGWDLPVLLAGDCDSKTMLAAMCLSIGYYIGLHEADRQKGEAEAVAEEIRKRDTWDDNLNRHFCDLAGLAEEYDSADGETFESVIYKAAERLGVEI